jgi:hypothetical protein
MTRILVFALNVMLFGLSAMLMVNGPAEDLGERQEPESLSNNAGALPTLV